MIMARRLTVLVVLALGLAGCGALDKLTGAGMDNTVLPGQREDAIPGRTQFPDTSDPGVTRAGSSGMDAPPPSTEPPPSAPESADCPIDDPACQPASGDDTFSDPQ